MGYHPDVDAAAERAVETLKRAGATVVDVTIRGWNQWDAPELEVLLYEFKDGLNQYLQKHGAPHQSLESLIAWNKTHADTVMPFFGQELFEKAQATGSLTDAAYLKARQTAKRLAGTEGLLAAIAREKLDAVVAPSVSPAWPTDHVLGDRFLGAGYSMAAIAGTPSITVPVGESHGLPLGLTFMGRAYSEGELIGFAFALERLTNARKPPTFKPALDAR
jgi:amidase